VRPLVALFALALAAPFAGAQQLQTVAEKTDYKATSKYADVVAFCESVAKRGPTARLEYFGTSQEGRKLPLLVVSDPAVSNPAEAKEAGKLVVLVFANIHAGEVDGKEAVLALARDLTDKKGHPLLKDLVVLLVPILNADGNEKFGTTNRPGQNGPAEAGVRANAQGLDLNRDFVKLESPEIRALVKLFNTWDPMMVIDCHTTNGSKHRYTLTYDGPRYPIGVPGFTEWADNTLFPEVAKKVKAATGFDIAPYGNFNRDRTKWETYPATPRYGVQYFALRGKIGVLSESYTYASFADRVKASHAFVTACLEVLAAQTPESRLTLRSPEALLRSPGGSIPIRTETVAFADKRTILGFEEVVKDGKRVATEAPKDYSLDYVGRVVPTATAELPFAYLFPAKYSGVLETLQRHGVAVEELREDIELSAEAFRITAVEGALQPSRLHGPTLKIDGAWKSGTRRVPAETLVVKTAQPLGKLAGYLLEPGSEDGLAIWGLFTDGVAAGADFPVLRLAKAHPISTGVAPALPETADAAPFAFPQPGFRGGDAITWLDGDHFLQAKEGKLWKIHARTGKAVGEFTDPEAIKKSLSAIKDLGASSAENIAKGTNFRYNPDRTGFLVNLGSDLGIGYFDGSAGRRITKSEGFKEYVSFSPTGKHIAFVRGGNLFSADVEKGEEQQLTHDGGSNDILNAKGDWVYAEEIFLRRPQAYWWSPDGKQLAFMRFDDTPVKRFNIIDLNTAGGRLETWAYPKVGAPNPHVKIGVVPAAGGRPIFLDLGGHKPEDIIVSRVDWMPDSKTVIAYVQDRLQTWLDFTVWDSPNAKPKVLFRETTKAWVDDTGPPHFLPDGSFLFASDRSGYRHLYHYSADGKLLGPVTKGDWQVKSVLRVDGDDKTVYFTASYSKHTMTDLCRATIGKDTELLTEKGLTHRVTLAPSGPLFVDRASNTTTPPQSALVEAGKGVVRKLDTNPVRDRGPGQGQGKTGKHERVQIPLKDGFVLEGAITYPPDFDAKKKYPVWIFTYAGPHTPTVSDDYGGRGGGGDNSLAASGIIIFRVDPRSASGKSAEASWTCYKQLGVQELKDLEEAVAWLGKNEYVDLSRVGISGHSYGGFMAAYALTHSKVFSAGIASSPVTDWRLYDSIYTERYMLTPKENPGGYAKSSCVAAAKNLHGKLLIIHGMMDDNVHMQNSVQLVDALQKAGKQFEMMFYPPNRHGIGGGHYSTLQNDFIRRTMGVQK
jgi:dipeptidyl aminopeptidase/acylaminoacyl peptidase